MLVPTPSARERDDRPTHVVFAGCLVLCSELVEVMPFFVACIAGCVAADP
jgi:hypothetical protein